MIESDVNHPNLFYDEKAPSLPPTVSCAAQCEGQPTLGVWCSGQPFHYQLPRNGNHWKECKEKADQFDRDFCAGWNSEIDSLLTFAGLFSAVITAFTVESYKWLQPDPQDKSNQILLNISAQLAGRNATALAPFSPSAASIRINVFWFLSLTFSLTAGLLGIVCKQWLRRYQRDASLPHEKGLALHQFRYEGLVWWKALDILGGLPLLLEIGLVLFFLGLADFLRDLNMTVAIPIIILISAGISFLIITTSTPAFQYLIYWARRRYFQVGQYIHPPMFAFKSPQSRMLLRVVTWLSFSSVKAPEWVPCEIRFISHAPTLATYTARGIAWLDATYSHTLDMVYQICWCMHDMALPVLRQLSKELLTTREHKHKHKRDGKPHRADAVLFEEYAKQVLDAPGVAEDVVRDIVTAVYLDHRLHVDHHRDDAPIVERRVRVLHASHLPVSPELFSNVFKDLALSTELRWQKAMLLRTLLAEGRMHAPSVVAAEVVDVCAYHGTFSDEDLDLFFDAVYMWMERDIESRVFVAHQLGGRFYGAGSRLTSVAMAVERPAIGRFQRFLDGVRWAV